MGIATQQVHNGRFGLLYLDQKGDVIGGPKRMGASFTCNCLRECDNNLVRMLAGLWWDEAAMMSSLPMSGLGRLASPTTSSNRHAGVQGLNMMPEGN